MSYLPTGIKLNLMKYFYRTGILLLLILIACVHEHIVERTYKIENKTNHEVTVQFFYQNSLRETVSLNKKDDYFMKEIKEDLASDIDAHLALRSDSVHINFDEVKYINYTLSDSGSRNLLSNNAYIIENKNLYIYSIAEEDYENAEEF